MNAARLVAAMVILGLWAACCPAAERGNRDFLFVEGNRIRLTGEQIPLGTVLAELRRQTGIETTGLEDRHLETVSLDMEATTAQALFRRLLERLKERNFAIEYQGGRLVRVSVLPASAPPTDTAGSTPAAHAEAKNGTVEVVRVQRILPGTQAEQVGLNKGDIVISYDNTMIENQKQLAAQARQTDPRSPVEMVIVRHDQTRRLTVNGGLIGIGIQTVRILKDDYNVYTEAIP